MHDNKKLTSMTCWGRSNEYKAKSPVISTLLSCYKETPFYLVLWGGRWRYRTKRAFPRSLKVRWDGDRALPLCRSCWYVPVIGPSDVIDSFPARRQIRVGLKWVITPYICWEMGKKREGFVKRGNKLQSSKFSTNSQENSIDRRVQSPIEKSHSHLTDTEHGIRVIWNKTREELERKDDVWESTSIYVKG